MIALKDARPQRFFAAHSMPSSVPRTVLAILGPTASGKSSLALELAQRYHGEIVSMDSALVYRGMDIGTAKPTRDEQAAVPHHLIDLIEPTASYSAARFVRDCLAACATIHARGKLPIITGGTMLYYKALVDGLDDLPESDLTIRATIEAEAATHGWPHLHAELAKVDPPTAARLHSTDAQRISRALEVFRMTARPLSAFFAHRPKPTLPFRLISLSLEPSDRAALHRRIEQRFDAMLKAGLLDEVRALRERYPLNLELPSMRCVGYRQAWQHLDSELDATALRETGIAATRQLAKRQLTWLKPMQGVERFDCLDPQTTAAAQSWLNERLQET